MEEINKNTPPSPLIASAIAKTIQIRFESSKLEYCQPPESQTPFTNKPIKSQQQQHNINGDTNATINMKRTENNTRTARCS
jgi:hypothetical protein